MWLAIGDTNINQIIERDADNNYFLSQSSPYKSFEKKNFLSKTKPMNPTISKKSHLFSAGYVNKSFFSGPRSFNHPRDTCFLKKQLLFTRTP